MRTLVCGPLHSAILEGKNNRCLKGYARAMSWSSLCLAIAFHVACSAPAPMTIATISGVRCTEVVTLSPVRFGLLFRQRNRKCLLGSRRKVF